jgi:hypothetical protein
MKVKEQMRSDIHSHLFSRIKLEKAPYNLLQPCWIWMGARYNGTDQYGGVRAFKGDRRKYRVHRITFRLFKGFLGDKEILLHSCDNPSCCNPEHLAVGSHSQNMQDYIRRKKETLKINE